VVNELGFDAGIDYKAAKDPKELYRMLKEATPDGIDAYIENVGGTILDAVLSRMNPFGRIAMCGMIAGYDGQPLPMQNPQLILVSRLTI
uniref:zinc-binding dehydrogenase n=1 Tax=Klebsiella pneumoniae TaxID=573 RepID=UPI003B986B33